MRSLLRWIALAVTVALAWALQIAVEGLLGLGPLGAVIRLGMSGQLQRVEPGAASQFFNAARGQRILEAWLFWPVALTLVASIAVVRKWIPRTAIILLALVPAAEALRASPIEAGVKAAAYGCLLTIVYLVFVRWQKPHRNERSGSEIPASG